MNPSTVSPLSTASDLCFDYVIVGGGSAGCVLAARLSANPALRVALLEAGAVDSSALIHCPGGLALLAQNGAHNWRFNTVPQVGLNGRVGYQPRGKVLGGSSSINAMIYARGQAQDYTHWAQCVGEDPQTSRWGWPAVLQQFKAFEHNEDLQDKYHARAQHPDGVLNVKHLTSPNPFGAVFVQAGQEAGYPLVADFNGAWAQSSAEGVGAYQVTQKNGERYSAAKAFITPNLHRTNLKVITGAQATRVLFEPNSAGQPQAVGVEFVQRGSRQTVRAAREVILSAGAFLSPQLLMLSGIGAGAHLHSMGLPVLADVPGVGHNLHDHVDVTQIYDTPGVYDLLGLSLPGLARAIKGIFEWRRQRTGLLTTNFAEAGGFIKSDAAQASANLQLHFVIGKLINHGRTPTWGHGFSCHVCHLQPKSRGTVQLASAAPLAAPRIDPAFLSHADDLRDLVNGFKHLRRILQAPSLAAYRGQELLSAHAHSDEQIAAHIRQHADTIYHPVGTCKMGAATDPQAVVNSALQVRGVAHLRVVDASVMPRIVSGNTNAPTMMIAQTAADLILQELRVT